MTTDDGIGDVTWAFDPGEIPGNAVYVAAVIDGPGEPPPQQPGVVGPEHTVGLTVDRMVDLLASQLEDEFWRPHRMQLLGDADTATSPEGLHLATAGLSAMNKVGFPYTIYASIVPGTTTDGRSVIGIIVFYMKGENGNGHTGDSAPPQ